MPALTAILQRNADYYRMEWMSDGYPGRRDGDVVAAHPIYGAYALIDYLRQLKRSSDPELMQALKTVAYAAIRRMESFRDALVFWYEESADSSRATERHYSGLTQGYYAINLARAAKVLDDAHIAEAADRVFAALTLPAADGGVRTDGVLGPCIAEVSQDPPSFILNGWQSSLASIVEFAEVTDRDDARELAYHSAQEMARLLPLYDAPALRNSRYGLSGYVYARLVLRGPHQSGAVVHNLAVEIPGESELPVDQLGGRRWHNHVLEQDVVSHQDGRFQVQDKVLRINLVLSRISFPVPNRFRCGITGLGGTVDVQLQSGRYDPLATAPADRSWTTVARVQCPAGTSSVDVPLPWDVTDLIAYPTNFAKVIDGNQTNVYHMIHIRRLRELAEATGIRDLREWADTWLRYVGKWRSMPEYQGLYVRSGSGTVEVGSVAEILPASTADPVDALVQ
jgi:hypothetical protein